MTNYASYPSLADRSVFITGGAAGIGAGRSDVLISIGVFLFVVYLLFADALPNGQSVGKRILGIAVVDGRTGRPCSVAQSFTRNLLLHLLGIFDWMSIFGRTRQRLGDMLARTSVIRVRSAPEPKDAE